ncbi:4Fe-4S dicluster domain-containing protein [Dyella monticola]|uniref:4Fe-4S dicluster domain-containing protein n=1 Tax=Dyella monticola TaxID=1927958 RepID=A0A370WXB5_9GAMM|nr:TAT-variant-translocated molybdopterin oxidoreductase [Dyella monticola]RDS80788.1 4Fe-4S dicluster domain-containing protein [Dyella monticola]
MPPVAAERIAALAQRRLAGAKGQRFWRALEELADDAEFKRELAHALPQFSAFAAMDRRRFLQLLGASLAFGGLAACSGPSSEQIVPWVTQPPGVTPDVPQFYATSLAYAGDVLGVLVESRMGRPTKIEGNPLHPASLGATGPSPQAAVLELWDPDRSQVPLYRGNATTWDAFATDIRTWFASFSHDGSGLHVLSDRIVSPTLRLQRDHWLARFPGSRWYEYAPVAHDNAEQGASLAFGAALAPRYHFDRADVIVSLEADFLGTMPGRVAYARAFAERRKPPPGSPGMNRLYVVEATPSLTGTMADHQWVLASSAIACFALELARTVGVDVAPRTSATLEVFAKRLQVLQSDLLAHAGKCLVLAGDSQPPQVHALAHLLNEKLGNVGRTVDYVAYPDAVDKRHTLGELAHAIDAGHVQRLLVLDCNVAYNAPADLSFGERLKRVPNLIHWGLYVDETAQLAAWHLPASHALESWSDVETSSGVASIVQPLIDPLYQGRSMHELLALLMGEPVRNGLAVVQHYWRTQQPAMSWQESLRNGVIAGTGNSLVHAQSRADALKEWSPPASSPDALELLFRPDPTVWDGRYANNGWLQELPKPLTQLTWSNAALVSPQLAKEYALSNGEVITLECEGRSVQAPVWITPGQAARSITVHMGYGRTHAGRVGDQLGFNAFALRTWSQPWLMQGVMVQKTGRSVELASTQMHLRMEDREPVRSLTLVQLMADPRAAEEGDKTPPTLYAEQPQGDYSWGMTVDLNACIGCKGCTIACQAENNIPVVGADQVLREREMHWIRVDRYYSGAPEHPVTRHQPVPCMHCEHAPCELVCPVGATVHDSEGLNVQVYNRCIGTRFCSNNCPYKVRRFNFLQFSDLTAETLKAQRNPDVTVRNRGVMEKCTYCIQRIESAHINADREQRAIADGEIVTACQAACPTQAITFGNLRDEHSAVSRIKASPRNYDLLEELNTRPHTSYLAHLRNPHPDLEDEA